MFCNVAFFTEAGGETFLHEDITERRRGNILIQEDAVKLWISLGLNIVGNIWDNVGKQLNNSITLTCQFSVETYQDSISLLCTN